MSQNHLKTLRRIIEAVPGRRTMFVSSLICCSPLLYLLVSGTSIEPDASAGASLRARCRLADGRCVAACRLASLDRTARRLTASLLGAVSQDPRTLLIELLGANLKHIVAVAPPSTSQPSPFLQHVARRSALEPPHPPLAYLPSSASVASSLRLLLPPSPSLPPYPPSLLCPFCCFIYMALLLQTTCHQMCVCAHPNKRLPKGGSVVISQA